MSEPKLYRMENKSKVYEKKGITPFNRLLADDWVETEVKDKLRTEHGKLNPKWLHQELMKERSAILKANRLYTEAMWFTDV